jgi:nucleoside-diphosphate-sugar epimerase
VAHQLVGERIEAVLPLDDPGRSTSLPRGPSWTADSGLRDGRLTRDFTFVADAVRATRIAAASPNVEGGVYNIGGGTRVSLSKAISVLEELVGKPIGVDHLTRLPGDVRDTGADIDKVRAELHYEPATDLGSGHSAQLEWVSC